MTKFMCHMLCKAIQMLGLVLVNRYDGWILNITTTRFP